MPRVSAKNGYVPIIQHADSARGVNSEPGARSSQIDRFEHSTVSSRSSRPIPPSFRFSADTIASDLRTHLHCSNFRKYEEWLSLAIRLDLLLMDPNFFQLSQLAKCNNLSGIKSVLIEVLAHLKIETPATPRYCNKVDKDVLAKIQAALDLVSLAQEQPRDEQRMQQQEKDILISANLFKYSGRHCLLFGTSEMWLASLDELYFRSPSLIARAMEKPMLFPSNTGHMHRCYLNFVDGKATIRRDWHLNFVEHAEQLQSWIQANQSVVGIKALVGAKQYMESYFNNCFSIFRPESWKPALERVTAFIDSRLAQKKEDRKEEEWRRLERLLPQDPALI